MPNKVMRILLVQFDARNPGFPLGLAQVAAVLQKEGYEVSYLDLSYNAQPVEALTRKVAESTIEAIGVTLFTTSYGEFLRLFRQCEQVRHVPVIAGGVHAEIDAEQILQDGFVRVAVRFEGEVVAPSLFRALEDGKDLSAVEGIAYLDEDGRYVETPLPRQHADLDKIPRPAYDLMEVTRHKRLIHGRPAAMVFTSRGCPYRCAFCYRGPASGKIVRFKSIDQVIEELCYLHSRFGFTSFAFRDDQFTFRRNRVIDLCSEIIARELPFHWTCQSRVDHVDVEILRAMKQAGCVGIRFGVESGHPEILKKLNKGTTPQQIEQAFDLCRKLRIPTVAHLIVGAPWDTEETDQTTIAMLKKIKPTVSLFFAARPFPKTPLREAFIEHGMAIPVTYDDYAYFVEGHVTGRNISPYLRQEAQVRRKCIQWTRRILLHQITDVFSYPRLITELITMYGMKRFTNEALRRLRIFSN
jgi:radical SAM superfamily enzyme YgiQ (UPF0313 family)